MLLSRFLTYLYLPVFNLVQLLCPSTLSYDWQLGSVPLVTMIADTRNVQSGVAAVTAVGLMLSVRKVGQLTPSSSAISVFFSSGSQQEAACLLSPVPGPSIHSCLQHVLPCRICSCRENSLHPQVRDNKHSSSSEQQEIVPFSVLDFLCWWLLVFRGCSHTLTIRRE